MLCRDTCYKTLSRGLQRHNMSDPRPHATSRIFISYRREETAYPAGWLFDRLVEHYGEGQIFKDVDSIELGDDFVEVITKAVGSTDVLLALIGDEWLTVTDEDGRRRLDDPADFVRVEIEAALARAVRVIPILVDGARMPRADELPASLAPLARRQALELNPSRFASDTTRLLKVLENTLGATGAEHGALADHMPPAARERVEQARRGRVAGTAAEARPTRPLRGRLTGRRLLIALAAAAVVVAGVAASTLLMAGGDTTVFEDDFSTREAGWADAGDDEIHGGHYVNNTYRIYADQDRNNGQERSRPRSEDSLYPSAPPNIRVAVDSRKLAGGESGYGMLCRDDVAGYKGYAFQIWETDVAIVKYFEGDPGFETLNEKLQSPAVRTAGVNKVEAACTNDDANEVVHLAVWVNGRKMAEATDADEPFLTGTVGLFVSTEETIEVQFDNFAVEPYEPNGR
jgi:hypothetical protein